MSRPRIRITLTKAQAAAPAGAALIRLLEATTADGVLSEIEVTALRAWLNTELAATAALPAVEYLRRVLDDALGDGVLTDDERLGVLRAIERVLPPASRTVAKDARVAARLQQAVGESAVAKDLEESADGRLASSRQKAYLRALGHEPDEALTLSKASTLIDQLKRSPRPSPRQRMVLRFWDQRELESRSREEVSDWMDEWYDEDPRRLQAWETWKRANTGANAGNDPALVPVGMGHRILAALPSSGGRPWRRIALVVVAVLAVLFILGR